MLTLLCAKGNCFDARGRGGMGVLRPADMAHALAGLPEKVFLFGLYTVIEDRSVQEELVRHAYLEARDLANTRGWLIPADVLRRMGILALCEVAGIACLLCARRGKVQDATNGVVAVCPVCFGSGLRRLTSREREREIGLGGPRWVHRYEGVWRRVDGWRTTLEDHLRTRLARAAGRSSLLTQGHSLPAFNAAQMEHGVAF